MLKLDRAIEALAPIYAARRAQARLRLKAYEAARAYYDGADVGRRGASIRRSGADAQTVAARTLPRLRNGSRDLIRNNPHAMRGKEAIISNTIGAGIIPRFKRGKETVAELEDLARRTLDSPMIDVGGQLDYYGQQGLFTGTMVESGEALIVRRFVRDAFPVRFQVLEPDFLDTSRDGITANGGRVIQGVEYDAEGRRVRYWLFPEHPGGASRMIRSEPWPAQNVAHVYRIDRAGQVRGIPWLAPVLLRLADFDDYENAQLVRQKIAACFAVFEIDTMGGEPPKTTPDKVEPGMITRLSGGTDIKFANPPEVNDYKDYAKVSLRAIAAGLGVSYEALTGDLEGVNFSSGRMGWLEFQRNIDRWRWHTIIPQACSVMMRWWLEGAELAGFDVEGVEVRHTPPARQMISPEREVPAKVNALKSGQMTLRQIVEESGRDLDEHLDDMQEEREMLNKRGISLDFTNGIAPVVQQDGGTANE